MTKLFGQTYQRIAIILCITLVASLLPRNMWGTNNAYAYTATIMPDVPTGVPNDVTEATMDALQDAPLSTEWVSDSEQLANMPSTIAQQPQLQENAIQPLSIARTQSAYYAGETISNTVIVTYTITNNQLPANLPQLTEGATLTDTVAALEQFETERAHDPNVIRNVLLVDSLTTHSEFASAMPAPDEKNGEYAWNLVP